VAFEIELQIFENLIQGFTQVFDIGNLKKNMSVNPREFIMQLEF